MTTSSCQCQSYVIFTICIVLEQSPRFEENSKPNRVFKVKRALYGLRQAIKVWYEMLSNFLLDKGFYREKVDTILFSLHKDNVNFIFQIYVDNIIFGSINEKL